MTIKKNTLEFLRPSDLSFIPISNEIIEKIKDVNALGLYCYLASKPLDEAISKKEIQTRFNCDLNHINKCLDYLRSLGVLDERIEIDDERGMQ